MAAAKLKNLSLKRKSVAGDEDKSGERKEAGVLRRPTGARFGVQPERYSYVFAPTSLNNKSSQRFDSFSCTVLARSRSFKFLKST